jgi:outer membrane protein TolC|tara:strand:+ start:12125 stop:13450 length:1326 start_codon:yes stop_codon:yes gene_type:complete
MKLFSAMKHYLLLVFFFPLSIYCQDVLNISSALEIALRENIDIKIKLNKERQAKNLNNIGTSGLLPKININAAAGANKGESSLEFATDDFPSINDVESESSNINSGVEFQYNIFNGLASIYTFQTNKKLNELQSLETQIEIENVILKLSKEFYDVFYLQEQKDILQELISISSERFQKIKIQYEFGNVSKLDLLDAELDLYNDSTDFKRLIVQLTSSKNSLNQTLNREINLDFLVEVDEIFFREIKIDDLLSKIKRNKLVLAQMYRLEIAKNNKKINNSSFFPRVGVSAQYGYTHNESNTSLISNQSNLGFTGNLNFTWPIFDGFSKRKALQNAKIEVETNKLRLESVQKEVIKELYNLYNRYQNNLELINIENKNVKTAKKYFDRASEQYFEGFIGRNEFRLAQLEFSMTKTKLNQTIFNTKILEINLFSLSGEILEVVK